MMNLTLLLLATLVAHISSLSQKFRSQSQYVESIVIENKFAQTFSQRLDHFDRQNNITFNQRYFINDTFWKGNVDSPVFMCVGGEGPPIDYAILISSVHCNDMVELAPKVGALMVALEHRYYGFSNPFDDFSTEHLKWLNSEQAVGDIATFHSLISTQYKLTTTNKWITYGGSYPGMLAAIARLRYPHLIYAAVSSSAPLVATVDMVGYNNVVSDSISNPIVGGSEKCYESVKEGHEMIRNLLITSEGRRSLETMFNICEKGSLDDIKNQEEFAGNGVIYLPIQSNDPACTTSMCDISKICTYMTTDIDPLKPTNSLDKLVSLSKSNTCLSINYQTHLISIAKASNSQRIWLYQTCSEWGFYQTCNNDSNCPYTKGLHTKEIDFEECFAAFNITSNELIEQINYTNSIYGGSNFQGSRILFVNAGMDCNYFL